MNEDKRKQKAYRVQASIPLAEAQWLSLHPEINISGLLILAIRREMLKEKEFLEKRRLNKQDDFQL